MAAKVNFTVSGAVATRDLVFVSGANPSVNGTLPDGIEAQTAAAIRNIAAILEEAGTSWDNVVKTTVFLANWDDYASMNKIYGEMIPDPKPARSSAYSPKLPGNFLIEMEATAAIPRNRC
ncbi:RutC family protein [Paramyrothecium foliicola]|nr:RutC family protein [Paramyrothecium foliicola]